MSMVHDWMWKDGFHREVVTVAFENRIHAIHQNRVRDRLRDAGFSSDPARCHDGRWICVFDPRPAAQSPMTVPGRGGESWSVRQHGFPTLNQMADANNRLVVVPDMFGDLVRTGGVGDSFDPDEWTNSNGPADPDNFRYPLFLIEHTPPGPSIHPVLGPGDFHYLPQAAKQVPRQPRALGPDAADLLVRLLRRGRRAHAR